MAISSDLNREPDIEDIGKLDSSDHDIISCKLHIMKDCSTSNQIVTDWKKVNLNQKKHGLLRIEWEKQFGDNIEESWCDFKETYNDYIIGNVSFKSKRNVKSKKIWITREVIRAIRRKKRLWRKFNVTRELSTYTKYKDAELHVNYLLKIL